MLLFCLNYMYLIYKAFTCAHLFFTFCTCRRKQMAAPPPVHPEPGPSRRCDSPSAMWQQPPCSWPTQPQDKASHWQSQSSEWMQQKSQRPTQLAPPSRLSESTVFLHNRPPWDKSCSTADQAGGSPGDLNLGLVSVPSVGINFLSSLVGDEINNKDT